MNSLILSSQTETEWFFLRIFKQFDVQEKFQQSRKLVSRKKYELFKVNSFP